jgi:hypothetical protein
LRRVSSILFILVGLVLAYLFGVTGTAGAPAGSFADLIRWPIQPGPHMLYLVGMLLAVVLSVILMPRRREDWEYEPERPSSLSLEVLLTVSAVLVAAFAVTSYIGFLQGCNRKILAVIAMLGACQALVGFAWTIGLLFKRPKLLALYVPSSLVILLGGILYVFIAVFGFADPV